MKPRFFAKPSHFREWLEKNHSSSTELLVGFYKKATGKPSITWPESVDQALCFGWIDGVRKSLDGDSYTIRFTPRKAKSHWSAVNLRRFDELRKMGLVHPKGLEAFERMDEKNSKQASFEQKKVVLDKKFKEKLQENPKAWAFFQKLAPSYKRASTWWVINAKREETKWGRLDILIKSCAAGKKIPILTASKKK